MFVRDFHYDYQLRFIPRDATEWPPIIHSIPKVQGRVEKLKVGNGAYLLHLMDETMHEYIEKMNLYIHIFINVLIQKNILLKKALYNLVEL
jgi:hypothetical protein